MSRSETAGKMRAASVSMGLHGLARDGAAAVAVDSQLVAVSLQERLSRVRRAAAAVRSRRQG